MLKILRRLIWVVFVLLILLVLALWVITPYALENFLKDLYQEQGAEFQVEKIRVNPFMARISVVEAKVSKDGRQPLTIGSLATRLNAFALFDNKVEISELSLQNSTLAVIQTPERMEIAGLDLAQLQRRFASQETSPGLSETSSEPTQNPLSISLPEAHFEEIAVTYQKTEDGKPTTTDNLRLNSLRLHKIQGSGDQWSGFADISLNLNGATYDGTTELRYSPESFTQWLEAKLLTANISQFAHYLPSELQDSHANLTYVGQIVLQFSPETTAITVNSRQLDIDRVALGTGQVNVEAERNSVELISLQWRQASSGSSQLQLEGQLSSSGVSIYGPEGRNMLAAWEKLALAPFRLEVRDNEVTGLTLPGLTAEALQVSRSSGTEGALPSLLTMKKLEILDSQLTDSALSVDLIKAHEFVSNVHLTEGGELITLVSIAGASSQTPAANSQLSSPDPLPSVATTPPTNDDPASTDQVGETKTLAFRLNRFETVGPSTIVFRDQGVTPPYEQTLEVTRLALEGINTAEPEQPIHVQLEGKTNRYSAIRSDTRLWPFAEQIEFDTRTLVSEVELPPVSPYLNDALGYGVESGQLDLELSLALDQGLLDGRSEVTLRQFDLGAGEVGDDADAAVIPLHAAVAMLKDSDNAIKLDIPISGDVNSPEFGWGSFLGILFKKALFEVSSTVVMQSLVPYGNVIKVAQIAGEQALKMRVEPLSYSPAVTDTASHSTFIGEMRGLLKEREDMQVKACAFATVAELSALQPELAVLPPEPTAEQMTALTALAAKRGEAFKEALLAEGSIKSSRIALCRPQVDKGSDATPRIEFSL